MKNFKTIIIFTCISGVLLTACNNNKEAKTEAKDTSKVAEKPKYEVMFTNDQYKLSGIQTGTVEKRSVSNVIKANGTFDVEPHNIASVSAPLGGYVRSAGLLPGQAVIKGQSIAVIENPEFINIQQEYLESKAKQEYLELEYKRQETLRKEEINSAKTFQRVSSDLKMVKVKMTALEEKLALIGINKSSLLSGKISRTANLYAPISGYITASNVNMGKYVTPTDILFEIANKNDIHLALNVFEKDIVHIRTGQQIRFAVANETDYKRKAQVFLIGKSTGNDGIIPVHAHLSNPGDVTLLPGMYAKAVIEISSDNPVNTLPVAAIVQSAGRDFIFIEIKQDKDRRTYKMIPVKKGIEEDGYTEVILPDSFNTNTALVVIKGAYALLSAIKNVEE